MSMVDRLRADFRSESPQVLFILGLSMTVTGGLTASAASEIGIGRVFGAVLLGFGILTICGTVVWGTGERAHES